MSFSRRTLLTRAASGVAVAAATGQAGAKTLDVRRDFPITSSGRTFLDSAYITPIPRQVVTAAAAFAEAKASRPLQLGELLGATERVRRQFAALIKADADEVGLLFSTADGENVLAAGLDLKPGDNVVIDDLHYDTELILYRELEKSRGIQLRIARNRGGTLGLDDYEPLVDRRTRLVSVAYVSHRNGFRHDLRPLADLAHAHGALLYADAIQAVGVIDVDVRRDAVDCLCAGGYKWLLAGWGVAPFYVRREALDRIRLDRFGEMHADVRDDGSFTIDPTARRFDYSSRAFGEAHALSASLAYLDRIGVPAIEAHCVDLAIKLQREAAELGFSLFTPQGNRSAIVTIDMKQPMDGVRAAFAADRIDVTVRQGRVRIAPALFNSEQDIERALTVLARLK